MLGLGFEPHPSHSEDIFFSGLFTGPWCGGCIDHTPPSVHKGPLAGAEPAPSAPCHGHRSFPCSSGPLVWPCSYITCLLCAHASNLCRDLCLIDLILDLPGLFFSIQPPACKDSSIFSVLSAPSLLPTGHLPVTMNNRYSGHPWPRGPWENLLVVLEPLDGQRVDPRSPGHPLEWGR